MQYRQYNMCRLILIRFASSKSYACIFVYRQKNKTSHSHITIIFSFKCALSAFKWMGGDRPTNWVVTNVTSCTWPLIGRRAKNTPKNISRWDIPRFQDYKKKSKQKFATQHRFISILRVFSTILLSTISGLMIFPIICENHLLMLLSIAVDNENMKMDTSTSAEKKNGWNFSAREEEDSLLQIRGCNDMETILVLTISGKGGPCLVLGLLNELTSCTWKPTYW